MWRVGNLNMQHARKMVFDRMSAATRGPTQFSGFNMQAQRWNGGSAGDISMTRNIGISAHIDSGKTTLTERILYYTGRISDIHEVRGKDGVGAKMDSMELEREKGITIQSAATFCNWGDYAMNIIDTPGHVDFTVEVERALRVLDGAVLVLCGVSGVQSQSITVDRQMKRYSVPRIAFINKLDRMGANPTKVTAQLRSKLGLNAVPINLAPALEGDFEGVIDIIENQLVNFVGPNGDIVERNAVPAEFEDQVAEARAVLIEALADVDEEIGEMYLMEEEPSVDDIKAAIRRATIDLKFVPVLLGTALKNQGIQTLLDAVMTFLPAPNEVQNYALDQKNDEEQVALESVTDKPLVALAFKLEEGRFGQLTYIRVYQGELAKGDFVYNQSNGKKIKVPRLVKMHSDDMSDIPSAGPGDIVALFGVECSSGDTFTDGKVPYTMTSMHVPTPVISLAVKPVGKGADANFSKALQRFMREDPTFRVHVDPDSNETIISGMGELHLEVYCERMKREYKCAVEVGQPQVNYLETITQRAEFSYLHKKQSGGSGQFGKVEGWIEPVELEQQANEFVNQTMGGSVPVNFIPACKKGFDEAAERGFLIGHKVVDVQMVLTDGASHQVDSSELAFSLATKGAFKQAFDKAGPQVLEPIMNLEVAAPVEFQGAVIGQVNRRKGIVNETESETEYVTIRASVPLSQMFGYSTDIRSITQGKGEFTMEYSHHAGVPRDQQAQLASDYLRKREEESAAKK